MTIAKEARAQIVSPEFHLATVEQVKAAHAAGLEVLPCAPEDWAKLQAAGVVGIISDNPAGLIAFLKGK